MVFDLVHKCLARVFSTWLSLRILMAFAIVWCIIVLGLSGGQSQAVAGDFNTAHGAPSKYTDFVNQVCSSSPYFYLKPFQFNWQQMNATTSTVMMNGVLPSTCPWPIANSTLRFTITVFALVTVGVLFLKTFLSIFARTAFLMYALLFFASFVLDANASIIGIAECTNGFVNTNLNTDLVSANVALTCIQNFNGLVVIDLLVASIFFLLFSAWGMCQNLYNINASGDDKSLLDMGLA